MAAGTLLGWEVGLAGGGLFVLGAWRSASDRRA
jgi:hypothetical protein